MKRIVVVGGGFAGLNVARGLGNRRDVEVTVVDRRNHHLFQPLLYQVAMAGLSPAEIAAPIRALLASERNVSVRHEEVSAIDTAARRVITPTTELPYDVLVLASGARDAYFGHEDWVAHAPGLKSLEQALDIRRRVLTAYERAETEPDPKRQRADLTFVVVGGGPTGVELAGALGEMSRYTLARDFRHIDPTLARVILIEAGPRILPAFSEKQAQRVVRDLEGLGVQVWVQSPVTHIDAKGVEVGDERVLASTVLWAAGVRASTLASCVDVARDKQGRLVVDEYLHPPGHPEIFVAGDLAHRDEGAGPLPGVAPVAIQQGRYIARAILASLKDKPMKPFAYRDRGQMATIGRSRAIVDAFGLRFGGWFAWLTWLVVHIYFLVGFKNRLFVVIQWAWAYMTFRRGARLILATRPEAHPPETG